MAEHQKPFQYEDIMESVIQSVIARNNRCNPDGLANELMIPPKRIRQQLERARWYKPEQHANSPYISASIDAPSVLDLDSPFYPITVTLRHHENPIGNPDSRPTTFQLKESRISGIDTEGEIHPWLLMHHDPSASEGGLKEIDGEEELDCHAGIILPEDYLDPADLPKKLGPEVNAENGFITMSVGDSMTFQVQWRHAGRLVEKGERYSFCHRGTLLRWWEWGTLEELKGTRQEKQDRRSEDYLWIACTNVVEFTVECA